MYSSMREVPEFFQLKDTYTCSSASWRIFKNVEGQLPRGAEESAGEETQLPNIFQAWVDWDVFLRKLFVVIIVLVSLLLQK